MLEIDTDLLPRSHGRLGRLPAELAALKLTLELTLGLMLALLTAQVAAASEPTRVAKSPTTSMVTIPGGSCESGLPPAKDVKQVRIGSFRLDRTPVTNAQFAGFLRKHPEWRRDKVARVFADEQYLSHWQSALEPAKGDLQRPVVHVSWFAASAYCESKGGRLPTWYEWEYVAAASSTERDARNDPEWRQQILSWYSRSGRGPLPTVGGTPGNV